MNEFRIAVDLSAVAFAASNIVNERVFPLLAQAVAAVAEQTRNNWIEAIQRSGLWSGERDAYAGSVELSQSEPFSALVWSDYKYAEQIESGRPARDLKRMLDTSPKVRRSKSGKRYMIIPFRHGTPGTNQNAMPDAVYALARELKPSSITGSVMRESGLMASDIKTRGPLMVSRNTYSWGERVKRSMLSQDNKRKYSNLYRFDTSTPGGSRYSSYMTFRVMVEGSNGWIVPAKPGLHIAQKTAEAMAPLAKTAFEEAMRRSVPMF